MSFLAILREKHILLLWSSQLLSAMGDQFYSIALVWMAVKILGSGAGIIIAIGSLVTLACSILGGALADRWDRRWILIGTDIVRAMAIGALPLLLSIDAWRFYILVIITIIVEAAGSLFNPALQASLPRFTGDSGVLYATNALIDATQRLARILGPGLTGILLLVLPLPHLFTLDAASFCISALALFMLGRHFVAAPIDSTVPLSRQQHIFADIAQMFRLLWGHRALTWALVSLGISNIAWSAVLMIGAPLLVSVSLKGDAGAYGLLVSAYGIGNIISLFVVGGPSRRYTLRTMFIGQLMLGAGFLVLGFASSLPIAMCGALLAAFGSPMGDLIMLTIIQTDFPSAYVGKVYSMRMLLAVSGLALGQLLATPLYHFVPISFAIALCSALILVVGLAGLLRFRKQRLSDDQLPVKMGDEMAQK